MKNFFTGKFHFLTSLSHLCPSILIMGFYARCPHEVSAHIVSYLSQHDLTSTSRVSRQLHEISQPLLYKEPCVITGSKSPPPLYLFLRTLLTPGRETLVTHVRWLTVHWTDVQYNHSGQPDAEIALFTTAASALGLANTHTSGAAQVVLLLHLLPRLRTLHVIPAHDRDKFDEFMSAENAIPLALQSLQEFRWYSADRRSGVSPTMLLTLLGLPSIRIIDVHMVTELESPFSAPDAATVAMATSPATHLEFSFGEISTWTLSRILKIPRALTHLTYRAVSGNRSSLSDVAASLAPLRSTLQHLDLDLFRCIIRVHHGAWQTESFGSLREWPVLRNVRCSLMTLLGKGETRLADVLPPGLRALETVSDPFWTVEEAVCEVVAMLARKHVMLPRLRTVAVHVNWPKSEEMVGRLSAACTAAGVRLVEGCAHPFV